MSIEKLIEKEIELAKSIEKLKSRRIKRENQQG